jgi:hypothetical protein
MPPSAIETMRRRTASLRASADSDPDEAGSMLLRCAWCDRIAVGEAWLEGKDFQNHGALTHGICPDCFAAVRADRLRRHPVR